MAESFEKREGGRDRERTSGYIGTGERGGPSYWLMECRDLYDD